MVRQKANGMGIFEEFFSFDMNLHDALRACDKAKAKYGEAAKPEILSALLKVVRAMRQGRGSLAGAD